MGGYLEWRSDWSNVSGKPILIVEGRVPEGALDFTLTNGAKLHANFALYHPTQPFLSLLSQCLMGLTSLGILADWLDDHRDALKDEPYSDNDPP